MLSKSTIKLINSLSIKKYRQKEEMFLVEGDKITIEVLKSEYQVLKLYGTSEFISKNTGIIKNAKETFVIDPVSLKKASLLKQPQNCLAICKMPANTGISEHINGSLSMYIDGVQDPGNFGTIIRICDWFGLTQVFCSPDTVDIYNPKVIQASMGSFCRIQLCYSNFEDVLKLAKKSNISTIGAFMDGSDIYREALPLKALLIVGNEGNGIRPSVKNQISRKITIPTYRLGNNRPESLNVAIATGIICAEFRRQHSF